MPAGCRVAVATVGSSVTFLTWPRPDAPSASTDPGLLVMGDVDAPFAPAGTDALFAHVSESTREHVASALASLPTLHASTLDATAALGAGLAAAAAAVAAGGGGRVVLVAGGGVRAGALALPRGRPPPPPWTAHQPPDEEWASFLDGAADAQTSLHAFVAPPADDDGLAPLATAAAATGGEFCVAPRWAPSAAPTSGAASISAFLHTLLSRHGGWEGVGVLRVGKGLTVTRVDGAPCRRRGAAADLDFPALSPSTTLAFDLAIEAPLTGPSVALQFALAYTTPGGERRVRVHTLSLPVATSPVAAFRGADGDALLAAWARSLARALAGKPGDEATLVGARERARGGAVSALAAYRRTCARAAPGGQLILPDVLKLAPLASLALAKAAALAPGWSPDARTAVAATLARCAPEPLARRLLPLVVRLLLDPSTLADPLAAAASAAAAPLSLSAEAISPGDVVALVGEGGAITLHSGARVDGASLLAPLGWPAAGGPLTRPPVDAPDSLATRFWRLLDALVEARGGPDTRARAVTALPRGAGGDAALAAALVEDRGASGPSYVEHLCWVHRMVQKALQ